MDKMGGLISEIRDLILMARKAASRGIDLLQVLTNFEIGRRIVQYEQEGAERATYGKETLKELAIRLEEEFGKGFSKSNLAYMRKFYLNYQSRVPEKVQTASGKLAHAGKVQTVSGKLDHAKKSQTVSGKSVASLFPQEFFARNESPFSLSWSQYVFLLGIKKLEERNFYEIEAAANGWSIRELKRQFDTGLYERLALSRNKDEITQLAKKGQLITKPQDLLKEPYVLEFLGLDETAKYSENELETAIINKLEHFLLELGKGFLFEARQKRFTFDEDHFFVDLVFYNRLLSSYVLIDLKIGKLTHQDLGQMQMYVNYYDRYVKKENEQPTIGIILCKKKHDALVEITLPTGANIHAREYQLYLPSKDELKQKLMEWAKIL